jgi:FMN phosphatase YigB (HAD superfamily)
MGYSLVGLFTNMLLREIGIAFGEDCVERFQKLYSLAYKRFSKNVRPLLGAKVFLAVFTKVGIPWGIAISGRMETAAFVLAMFGIDTVRTTVVIWDEVRFAKPEFDFFLAVVDRLKVSIETASVVGTAFGTCWRPQGSARSGSDSSGGTARRSSSERRSSRLRGSGRPLLKHLDEVGGRRQTEK